MKDIILCVDDEIDLLELLEFNLKEEFNPWGYEVICCLNTKIAREFLQSEDVALIIMDRNLKGEDGLEFIKEIKALGYGVAVIFLSALNMSYDMVKGLALADDYVAKPFSFEVLNARIKAVLRRYKIEESEILRYKNLELHTKNKELIIESECIDLTSLEVKLLSCFLKNQNQVLSREYLMQYVWDISNGNENIVNVAIKRLRKKVEKKDRHLSIKSIRSLGYKLC